ncbi:MAG: prepilin peptidase [Blautia sp.]|nr:prepilin peptidase [Blautia sp.]
MELLQRTAVLILLGYCSWTDFHTKRISAWAVAPGIPAGIILAGMGKNWTWDYFSGFGIGGVFLGLSVMTRGGVGMGDALLLLGMNAFLSWEPTLLTLTIALLGTAVYGSFLLAACHRKRSEEVAFIPFLLGGYVLTLFLGG